MIGVAVVGAGRIGQIHARNLQQNPAADLRYIVDVSAKAARQLAAECATEPGDIESVLADPLIRALVIASPTTTHAGLIAAAAAAGKAIFCEKLIDHCLDGARKSLAVVEEHQVLLCLGFNRRHDPSIERLKQEIAGGSAGRVEVVSIINRDPVPPPPGYIETSGGLFLDMMIHDFDMARWLFDEEPAEVFATGSVLVDPAIGAAGDLDTAIAVLKTASGRICQITNSRRCSYGYDQRIEVFGSDAMVRVTNLRETQVETANRDGFRRDPVLPFFLQRYAASYRIQMDKFLRVLGGEAIDLPGGIDGLRALQIANAAQRSIEERAPITL